MLPNQPIAYILKGLLCNKNESVNLLLILLTFTYSVLKQLRKIHISFVFLKVSLGYIYQGLLILLV